MKSSHARKMKLDECKTLNDFVRYAVQTGKSVQIPEEQAREIERQSLSRTNKLIGQRVRRPVDLSIIVY